MKLAKKNDQAVLSFEINGLTTVGRKVRVAHDVKIEILKPADVAKLTEPLCPEPDVSCHLPYRYANRSSISQTHILLPPLQKLRTIVERMRPMSDILSIRANNSGSLQISINTESVKVDTEWKNCKNPKMTEEDPPDPEHMFSVMVSIRSFLKFLNSHVVSTTTIACVLFFLYPG